MGIRASVIAVDVLMATASTPGEAVSEVAAPFANSASAESAAAKRYRFCGLDTVHCRLIN